MLKDSKYYSKILLFGEYGIIKDSMGLSIPYNDYNGTFIFSDKKTEFSAKSNASLNKFYQHLLSLENTAKLPCKLNLKQFKTDIEKGIFFDSSIPQGFGIGSSLFTPQLHTSEVHTRSVHFCEAIQRWKMEG